MKDPTPRVEISKCAGWMRDESPATNVMAIALASTMKMRCWIGSTLFLAVAGPPAASFVLLPWLLLSGSPAHFDFSSYLVTFIFLAVPVGYVFGIVPAILAGATYSATLIALPPLRTSSVVRSCVGAASGAFWAALWFPPLTATTSGAYVVAAALIMALLALRSWQ